MSENLDQLRQVAENAAPGPWRFDTDSEQDYEQGIPYSEWPQTLHGPKNSCPSEWAVRVGATHQVDEINELTWEDVTHIATFDPPTVLALIDRVEAAEESRRLADVMLRAVLEAMGSGPETDPIIKVRQLVARAEAAERDSYGLREGYEILNSALVSQGERLEKAEAQVARVREIAKADLKCPCCSGYEEILRTLDGDTRRLADQGLGDTQARTTKNGDNK